MKGTNLGELVEIILLVVLGEPNGAYSVLVANEISNLTGRNLVHSMIHSTLARLEKKGMVVSKMGDATPERGGRRKRIYEVSKEGRVSLELAKKQRDVLWDRVSLNVIIDMA